MKNTSKVVAVVVTAVLFIAGLMTSCDNGGGTTRREQPSQQDVAREQSDTINFGTDLSATVQGTFTDTEWKGVLANIRTALTAGHTAFSFVFESMFDGGDFIIVVKHNPNFDNYDTTRGGTTVNVNSAILNNQNDLNMTISNAVRAAFGNPDIPTTAQVIPSARDKNWQIYNCEQRDKHITA